MKSIILIGLFLLCCCQLLAQKTIERQFQASNIEAINLDGTGSFEIYVESANVDVISVKTAVEGEYIDQVILLTNIKNNELNIGTEYQPLFTIPDDKLSAHKVMSIVFHLKLPKGLNVDISSDIGSVVVTGHFGQLTTELNRGHFVAKNFSGLALVNTIDGNIEVETNYAKVSLDTKNGQVSQEKLVLGTNNLSLHSINGNISVTKTK